MDRKTTSSQSSGGVGIAAVGIYHPEEIRENDWWPPEVVTAWQERLGGLFPRKQDRVEPMTPGVELTLQAINETRQDPFQGSRQRRVAPADLPCSEMEARAARDALARAGLDIGDVDLLLSSSLVPDYMACNHASIVHNTLGLRRDAKAMTIDAVCNSLFAQLEIASGFIESGRARIALLTQSCGATRVMPRDEPISAWHGDGATAVVVRACEEGYGVRRIDSATHGELHGAFVLGVPGSRWYGEGRVTAYSADRAAVRHMMLIAADLARTLVHTSLDAIGLKTGDIAFYASHQPNAWFRRVTQGYAGLESAQSMDTFPTFASMVACNLPTQLALAERQGLLKDGMHIAMFGVASGLSAYSGIIRWGGMSPAVAG